MGGYNEFCYKASSVSFFCLALLFTRIFAEPVGTRPWRAWCVCYLALAALPSLSVFAKAAPTLAFTESARLANMQRLWEATSTTRSIPGTPRYGAAEREPPSGPPISRKQGNPRTAPCAPSPPE